MDVSIPCWELWGRLADDDIVVVDCRSREERERVPLQIPGALRMSLDEIQHWPHSLPDDELIVLCDGSDGRAARRAWRILQMAGRTSVLLEGGLPQWVAEGYPTERVTHSMTLHEVSLHAHVSNDR